MLMFSEGFGNWKGYLYEKNIEIFVLCAIAYFFGAEHSRSFGYFL